MPRRARHAAPARCGSSPRTVAWPASRPAIALEYLYRRGLAGAVRPQEGKHLASGHIEVEPVHGHRGAVGLAEPSRLYDEFHMSQHGPRAGNRGDGPASTERWSHV